MVFLKILSLKSWSMKIKGRIVGGILVVISVSCYWAFSSNKIEVHPNRPLVWGDFKQVALINGRESINATCITTTDFQINRTYEEEGYKRIDLKAKKIGRASCREREKI